MTQTVNGNKNAGNSQKLRKPGQRQQDRLQRQQRRRRRQRIWTSAIVSVFIIILSVLGITQYQRYNADRAAAAQARVNATATGEAKLNATATAHANATATVLANLQASATASAIPSCLANLHLPPTPTAGPAKPPVVTTTPVTLADGLQYIDLRVGCGFPAKSGSTVSIEYTGWLQSTGKKFDSSLDRKGAPFSFQLGQGQVIKGFDEGLMGMKQGGFRRIIIPAALGYGNTAQGPIPPNSVLIFDVQMLSVK